MLPTILLFILWTSHFWSFAFGRCERFEFRCWEGDQCIPNTQVCDGFIHCLKDGSDERVNCSTWDISCPEHQWKCPGERQCIDRLDVCLHGRFSGISKCASGIHRDYLFCRKWICPQQYWKCKETGYCIPEEYVCDGGNDCAKTYGPSISGISKCASGIHRDYLFCRKWICPQQYWKCKETGYCIPEEYVCDGGNDCAKTYGPSISSDEMSCQSWNCSFGFWKCLDGSRCVRYSSMCYPFQHTGYCKDGSDQSKQVCSNLTCPEGHTKCADNSSCLSDTSICDGKSHCADGSDEEVGFCRAFQCPPGKAKCADDIECFSIPGTCNPYPMCSDLSDVYLCKSLPCSEGQWRCKISLQCISEQKICDGVIDCFDYGFDVYDESDEEGCLHISCRERHVKCLTNDRCMLEDDMCRSGRFNSLYSCGVDEEFCKTWTCSTGFSKCANNIHCVPDGGICVATTRKHCPDHSDMLCNDPCAPPDFHGRYIMRRCEEDYSTCVPTFWYCNGVVDCPDGSDEIHCTCEERGLRSCDNAMYCIPPVWPIIKHVKACFLVLL